ncbi:MAG: gamma carbonic anhydrase family protein [Alphaproteobacteria bacterium]|nr:gamma carbonic anhydrase family protein [Alphaproteobacteria bacterium]
MESSAGKKLATGLILPYGGHSPEIAGDVYIAPGAAVIGDVVIGEGSSIWFNTVVRGDFNEVRIGRRSNIQDGVVIHVASYGSGSYIGDDVTVGHNAVIHACTIGSRCLIGMNSTILDGAVVEDGALVAAGALVPPGKTVAAGELWAGNPAKSIRAVSDAEAEFIQDSALRYCKFAKEYMAGKN